MTLEIRVPSSKSITQRALVLAAISKSPCKIVNPLDCDDSQAMKMGLRLLGAAVDQRSGSWTVWGPGSFRAPRGRLQIGNAGTAARFLTGLAPLVPGKYIVDGDEAMRRRPMPGLLKSLASLGVEVEELGNPGCPPVSLESKKKIPGATGETPLVKLRAGGSSQELSALLLMGAGLPWGLEIEVEGELPSLPYVELTLDVMAAFGVQVERPGHSGFLVKPGPPAADEYVVEGDWSSASYPMAASWLTAKPVQISNLVENSVQGDRAFMQLLEQLKRSGPRVMDLSATPDLVPTLVACALFAVGSTAITKVAHLRIKESDRIKGLVDELSKLGANLTELPDGILVEPAELSGPATLDPANDHRLAMAFGLVSLKVPGIQIIDRHCVSKSYPDFWTVLEAFR